MKTSITLLTLICLIAFHLVACGGTGNNNPPNVEGAYTCTSGCSGACDFDNQLQVTQEGSKVAFVDTTGDINDDGEFATSSDSCSCTGQFANNTAVADCICQGTTCQSVTFTKN